MGIESVSPALPRIATRVASMSVIHAHGMTAIVVGLHRLGTCSTFSKFRGVAAQSELRFGTLMSMCNILYLHNLVILQRLGDNVVPK